MDPSGAVVLLFGGGDDLYAAAASAFAAAGARVALAGAPAAALDRMAGGLRDGCVVATEPAAVERARSAVGGAVRRYGRIDVLIHLPAVAPAVRAAELDAAVMGAAMEEVLFGPMEATRLAIPHMRRSGRGHVISVTAANAVIGYPGWAPHNAALAALSSWTRVMQAEWYGTQVAVTEFILSAQRSGAEPAARGVWGQIVGCERSHDVATRLVACVRRPRACAYAGLGARLLSLAGAWTRMRMGAGVAVAEEWRRRSGEAMFPTGATQQATVDPATALTEQPGTPAPAVPEARGEPVAAPPRRRRPSRAAAADDGAAPPSRRTRKRTANTGPVLSPDALERVRAAAERAAAAARTPARKRRGKRPRDPEVKEGESSDS